MNLQSRLYYISFNYLNTNLKKKHFRNGVQMYSSEGTWVHASDGSLLILINWKGGNQTISMHMKIVVKLDNGLMEK